MPDRRSHYRHSINTCIANADRSMSRDAREMWLTVAASYLFLLRLDERDAACPLCAVVPTRTPAERIPLPEFAAFR